MANRIIYKMGDSSVAVIIPAPEFEAQIEAVAAKDVPAGSPWRIVDEGELPSREVRDQWRWTDSGPLAVDPPPAQP